MKFHLKDIKISHKILIIFQFMSLPAIIIFIVLLFMMNKLHDIQSKILIENVTSITAAYNLENSLLSLKGLKANYFLDGRRKWLDEFDKNVQLFNYWYNKAFISAHTDEERNILSNMALDFSQYLKYHKDIINLVNQKRNREAVRLLLNDSMKYYDSIYTECEHLIKKNEEIINKSENELTAYLKKSTSLGYIIITCFIITGIMLVIVITKSIVDPIREIEEASSPFLRTGGKKGETERLKESFEEMIKTINVNQQKIVQSERRAAIGEVAAGISHELNNPIGIILGFSEILLKRKDYPEKEIVQEIHNEAVRCKKLLGEMFDFARARDPHFVKTDIGYIIKNTVQLFSNQDKYRNVAFHLNIPKKMQRIAVDQVQIKQVIMNILLNAFDANNNNGNIWINIEDKMHSVVIEIEDDGPGIKEDIRDKIFSPFFTNKTKGVGLGLAICRDLISKHNGSIELAEGGRGARFIITLSREHGNK